MMYVLGLIAAGYVCGSIPFGLLVGWLRGIDVRTQGSGNIGATNVGRVLGRGYGIAVFLLDVAKGFGPVLGAGQVLQAGAEGGALSAGASIGWCAVAVAAILGHMFPCWLGFRGGKGVATSLGACLGIWPFMGVPVLIAFGIWIVVTGVTRYVSVGSILAAVAVPILFAAFAAGRGAAWGAWSGLWPLQVFAVVIAILVVYRHRGNIQRLWAGQESKIGGSRRSTDPAPTEPS